MSEIGVVLKISRVGDREAMTSLNLLDKKGQEVVENIAGRTGKSLGAVASAYTRASAEGQKYFAEVAAGYQRVAAEEAKAAASAERSSVSLEGRQAHAVASATRGLEMIGRTGALTGRSLDAVASQVSQLAFGFGPTGQLVGAIGIATAAVVEMFMRTSREAKKLADETLKEFGRIAHMDVAAQGSEAARMYSGDDQATNELDRRGIAGNRRERDRLAARVRAGTTRTIVGGAGGASPMSVLTNDAKSAADELQRVNDWLKRIEPIYGSVYGAGGQGGSLARAAQHQIASDLPGFITDAQKDADKSAHAAETAAQKAAKAYAKSLAHDMTEASRVARQQMISDLTVSHDLQSSLFAMPKLDMTGISEQIAETIANDPIIKAGKAAKALGERLGDMLKEGISDGIANAFQDGFARAFAGGGAVGFIEGFGQACLESLGGVMSRMGAVLISSGVAMEIVNTGLKNPLTSGPAMIAGGALLVGLGQALKAAVSGSSSAGGSGYSGASSSLPQIVDRGTIQLGSYSGTDARSITARPMNTFNLGVINPNDGATQRVIDEINRKINQNGSLAGGR